MAMARNPAVVQYVIAKSEEGPYGVDSPYVDGTFSDDVSGMDAEKGTRNGRSVRVITM